LKIVVVCRRLRARPDGGSAPKLLGCCDEAALATAFALRDAVPGSQVTVLAAGPAEREDELLSAILAAGANRALRVWDPCLDAVDYLGIGRVLAAAARHAGFDLVIAGERSEDEVQGAVGPAVAESLGVPHLTGVLDLTADGPPTSVVATRREQGLVRRLRLPLPALVSVVRSPTRLPSWGPAVASSATPDGGGAPAIEALEMASLGIQAMELKHRDRCLGRAQPVRVTRNATMVADGAELLSRLRGDRLLDS
jgi:electron transfer flavoprotein beta subunit